MPEFEGHQYREDEGKTCKKCGVWKPFVDVEGRKCFHRSGTSEAGTPRYKTWCADCIRGYNKLGPQRDKLPRCVNCGATLDNDRPMYCRDCSARAEQYKHRIWFVCIDDCLPKPAYKGGAFERIDFMESLEEGVWPENSLWEMYERGQYQGLYRVVGPELSPQEIELVPGEHEIVGYGGFLPIPW